MKPGLVVFGEDWGRHPSSTQHIVRRLVADRPVVWINSIGMRRPKFTVRDLRRAADKLTRGRGNRPRAGGPGAPSPSMPQPMAQPLPPHLSIVQPLVVPWPGNRLAAAANGALLSRQINPRLAERSMARPILWTSLPTALPAVGRLGERAVVYYCGDDFGALAGVDHAPVLEMEAALVRKADLILAASEVLAQRFPAGKTLLVPHGADIGLFSRPAPRAADLPTGRPVAGFYGSIADWIDVDLLVHACASLPDWSFVFIGAIETDVTELRAMPNAVFLGPRPHADLPGYAQHWQASLLPFRDCPQIQACNPLKLREYLAAGAEIVTTDFAALKPYRSLVRVAHDQAAFVAALKATLVATDRSAARRACVAGETWEARAADVDRALDTL